MNYLHFDGETFELSKDGYRLTTQFVRVLVFMGDHQWHTLRAISEAVGGAEASVSARLRDFRKPRFGGYTVEKRRVGGGRRGLWEYRIPPTPGEQLQFPMRATT